MRDLTTGPIGPHLAHLAVPIAVGMVFQTLYHLVDLYFVAQLGDAAIAGVSAAGNLQFLVMAITQVLGVGTMALIANAVGRKDRDDAVLVFNQSMGMGVLFGLATLLLGAGLTGWYMNRLGADAETVRLGKTFLYWFVPAMGLQFGLVAMGSALRGTGVVRPTIVVQVVTVLINAALCPVLIAGWLTGWPMGVAGAGLASSISVAIGVALMYGYFRRQERYSVFDTTMMRPRRDIWRRILAIGLPTGGEFGLMFVYLVVVYWCIRDFGAAAQAGFGTGSRVMQALFLPAMAIAFAAGPLAGQNVGAGLPDRVRETFRTAAVSLSIIMFSLTLLCHVAPAAMIRLFTDDAAVIAAGVEFLVIVSYNFVAVGLVFTCSGLFQALGNTVPSLLASATRIVAFAIPAVWLTTVDGFELRHLWYLSVVTVFLQAMVAWGLLHREMKRKLGVGTPKKSAA